MKRVERKPTAETQRRGETRREELLVKAGDVVQRVTRPFRGGPRRIERVLHERRWTRRAYVLVPVAYFHEDLGQRGVRLSDLQVAEGVTR